MHKLTCALLIITVIAVDLLSKIWASSVFYVGEVLPIMPSVNLTLAHNTGAAFSFLANSGGWQRPFLAGLAIMVSIGFSVWLVRTPKEHRFTRLGLSLIIGGAIGNLADRLYYGYVVDFIDIYAGVYHWPAFNIADSAICVGTVLLLVGMKES